jgi:hypothetical protein
MIPDAVPPTAPAGAAVACGAAPPAGSANGRSGSYRRPPLPPAAHVELPQGEAGVLKALPQRVHLALDQLPRGPVLRHQPRRQRPALKGGRSSTP